MGVKFEAAKAKIAELEAENRSAAMLYHDAMEQLNCRDTDIDERDAKIKALEADVRGLLSSIKGLEKALEVARASKSPTRKTARKAAKKKR